MHFWIDKPAGRNYGFGGRRYPGGNSAPKSRSGQRGRRGREIGPMVTPIHRPHGCVPGTSAASQSNTSHPRNGCSCHPQQQQQQQHQQQQQQQQSQPAAPSNVSQFVPCAEEDTRNPANVGSCVNDLQSPPANISSNNVTNAAAAAAASAASGLSSTDRQILPNETTNAGLNRSGILDFSEMTDTELAGYRLRCGIWITFVLVTGLLSVGKFYFGNRDAGLDMLIFCGLLFTLLLSGCFYSTLFRRAHENHHNHQEHLEHHQEIATLGAAIHIRDFNGRSPNPIVCGNWRYENEGRTRMGQNILGPQPPPLPPPQPPPPPPPYHVAVMIPPAEETPPPSYEKAMLVEFRKDFYIYVYSPRDE